LAVGCLGRWWWRRRRRRREVVEEKKKEKEEEKKKVFKFNLNVVISFPGPAPLKLVKS
jgi:hypothetical protein